MRKTILSLILIFSIMSGLVSFIPITVNAASSGTCGDNLTWTLDDSGTLTISGTGDMDNFTSYSKPWESHETEIRTIIIESGITSIGNYAFWDCSKATTISIPSSVSNIGDDAFSYCNAVKNINVDNNNDVYCSVDGNLFTKNKNKLIRYAAGKTEATYTIPAGVSCIGDSAFLDSNYLESIEIPDSVTCIESSAFYSCNKLTNVALPTGLTCIEASVFDYCTNLENIIIPQNVTSIGTYAFNDCSKLTNITIPEGVTEIGSYAFLDCSSLESIVIPDSVTTIGTRTFSNTAFYNDSSNWQEGVLYIGNHCIMGEAVSGNYDIKPGTISIAEYAFSECSNLKNITIPESVISIGYAAFSDCRGLKNITIPKNVASIGNFAFGRCTSLTSIVVDGDNEFFTDDNGILFDKKKELLIHYPVARTEAAYTMPDSTLEIGAYAFSSCPHLTNVKLSKNLISIGSSGFAHCTGLTNVILPETLDSIGYMGFYNCQKLKSIVIPRSISSISSYAFFSCSKLDDVYYTGTEEDWNLIDIVSGGNNYLTNSTIHYNYVLHTITFEGDYLEELMVEHGTDVTLPNAPEGYSYIFMANDTVWDGTNVTSDVTVKVKKVIKTYTVAYSGDYIGTDTVEHGKDVTLPIAPEGYSYIFTAIGNKWDGTNITSNVTVNVEKVINTYTITYSGDYIGTDTVEHGKDVTLPIAPEGYSYIFAMKNGIAWDGTNIQADIEIIVKKVFGNGIIANGIEWVLYDNGLLSITGKGSMPNYSTTSDIPWYSNRANVNEIAISENITHIGDKTFYGCINAQKATIPNTVTTIGNNAFKNCDELTIYGETGTYAQTYAAENKIPFVNTRVWDLNVDFIASSTKWYFDVTVEGFSGEALVCVATYDSDGRMLDIDSENFVVNDITSLSLAKKSDASYAKVFVWTSHLQPITLSKKIDL